MNFFIKCGAGLLLLSKCFRNNFWQSLTRFRLSEVRIQDYFLNTGVLIVCTIVTLYVVAICVKTALNIGNPGKGGHIHDGEKLLRFLDDLGLDNIKNKRNQRLFEGVDKHGKKSFWTGLICQLITSIPGFLIVIVLFQIKENLFKLFFRTYSFAKKIKKIIAEIYNSITRTIVLTFVENPWKIQTNC